MSNERGHVISVVEAASFGRPKKTGEELRNLIRTLAAAVNSQMVDEDIEWIAREIEAKQGIKAGLGAIVDREDFVPWLDDAKSKIDPFYWTRYRKFTLMDGLPPDFVISMDKVSDTILSRLGNPDRV